MRSDALMRGSGISSRRDTERGHQIAEWDAPQFRKRTECSHAARMVGFALLSEVDKFG